MLKKTSSSRSKKYIYGAPALLEFESGWLIEYKYMNKETGELTRHREKFQRIRKKIGDDKLTRQYARKRIIELEELLKSGWTPYGMQEAPIENRLIDLLDIYATIKERELRPDSMRSLRSYNRLFIAWLEKEHLKDLTIQDFNHSLAQRYLDYILLVKKVSNRTYNNYLGNMRVMWNWFINERNFEVPNPFAHKKKKPVTAKIRKTIPKDIDEQILEYCRKNNPVLELVCHLIYSSYMRVSEIVKCKISDVHLNENCILLPGAITKNKKPRIAYLNKRSVEIMLENGLGKANLNDMLIGKEKGENGRLVIGWHGRTILTNDMDRSWEALRKALNLPQEYKLYSWRDTGITDLASMGLPDDLIIKITGHLDKDMVNIYKAPHVDESVIHLLRKVSQTLGERKNLTEEEILRKLLSKE